MNNKNLYKAKLKSNGKWIEGFYATRKETTYCIKEDYERHPVKTIHYIIIDCMTDWSLPNELRPYVINENTLCRGTGIQIENGEWLWEHDVIMDGEDNSIISVIRWDEENARFVLDNYGKSGCMMEYGFDEEVGEFKKLDTTGFDGYNSLKNWAKVIGNKIDNPELLGVI